MTADLVQRLRKFSDMEIVCTIWDGREYCADVLIEAADEIERLTKEAPTAFAICPSTIVYRGG